MLPLKDINPTRRFPIVTYGLIAANVLVFLWELTLSDFDLQRVFLNLSVVPALFTQNPLALDNILDIFRSMFFHGGIAHIGGNMLYLWLFGDNIEDRFGIFFYLVIYFASGVAAAFAQIIIDPFSQIPLVGASGAIAGVLGAYLVLFPGIRVRGLIFLGYFARITELPAWIVLGFWFVIQLLNGFLSLGVQTGGGVAFFAHVGGFVVGAVMAWVLMLIFPQPSRQDRYEALYERAQRYRY
ncbi:MAG: rhomboid family intramembrane serine protease [Chloroflexi bacterium]|nr:MAG: rhomboid family intramembrane serine protease [Chloroflexota bacterium]MBL1193211.1 rhomboid family intramembrane serine protease [Chloroflexota bacterium]NOH10505.1 rhomboid family intramembrane serine protease [Chloroflexota bacterium]